MTIKAQVHSIFPEPIVEVSNVGIDQEKIQKLYAQQEWAATNADDNAEYFLQISKNLKVLEGNNEFKTKILGMINEYARDVLRYRNKFYLRAPLLIQTSLCGSL